jgi:hypothetical protein
MRRRTSARARAAHAGIEASRLPIIPRDVPELIRQIQADRRIPATSNTIPASTVAPAAISGISTLCCSPTVAVSGPTATSSTVKVRSRAATTVIAACSPVRRLRAAPLDDTIASETFVDAARDGPPVRMSARGFSPTPRRLPTVSGYQGHLCYQGLTSQNRLANRNITWCAE